MSTTKSDPARSAKPRGNGSGNVLGANSEIAKRLKEYYDGIAAEAVPDRFADLLSRLDGVEPTQKKD
ncbi:MAG: NepR family anti-sigma factor [Rhizobiaceae bacterium]